MGEVYRATDTRLKRQVAVKILPPGLAADPDRLARFQREAEVLASLNHPHIAAIYGLEDAEAGALREEREDLSQSPTLTSPAAVTGMGVILGTATYMSPGQARGRAVDKRTDVWAFGAVLYEMLTGARAFEPSTSSGSPEHRRGATARLCPM